MKGKHAGKIAHHDEGIAPSSTSREPIHSGHVLIRRDHLANVTSLEDERWKRTQPSLGATGWP